MTFRNDLGRAHELREAAVGLQVAHHEGDHLVALTQGRDAAVDVADFQRGARVGAADLGIDAVVDDGDLVAEFLRVLLVLPEGRRHAGIGRLEPHELDDVLGADAAVGVEARLVVGIEADVGADGMVVELEEAEQRGVGKDVLQVQRLAPAGMADDDVRHEALALQRQRLAGDFLGVEDAALGIADVAVGGLRRLAVRLVQHLGDVRQLQPFALGDEDHAVLRIGGEPLADVLVLPRHVLVDKEVVHWIWPKGWPITVRIGKETGMASCQSR